MMSTLALDLGGRSVSQNVVSYSSSLGNVNGTGSQLQVYLFDLRRAAARGESDDL